MTSYRYDREELTPLELYDEGIFRKNKKPESRLFKMFNSRGRLLDKLEEILK